MDRAIDLNDALKALDLSHIRFELIRLEDTIIFHLIERVSFPLNKTIYTPGAIAIPDNPSLSFFDWFLSNHERLHSLVRRYQSPDEYPFFPSAVATPILPPLHYPDILHPNDVNVNPQLKASYIDHVLPAACAHLDRAERSSDAQEHYGSTAVCDVNCLQALSRRIHFGKFVAESKFRKETERFVALIHNSDRKGIDEAITDSKVEQMVLDRLRLKAKTYGTDPSGGSKDGVAKINVDAVVAMYKDYVIPLTKEVEVEYLMQRLKGTEWEK